MAQYSFTCPLQGCNQKMTVNAPSVDDAAKELTNQAKQHLEVAHPDIHKTDQEVEQDIRSHMQQEG
jgi:hypothetical protein